jgi:hypothetical protein
VVEVVEAIVILAQAVDTIVHQQTLVVVVVVVEVVRLLLFSQVIQVIKI